MLLKLAWRNIWRNRRRTIISLLALSLGVTAIISIHSFREVVNEEMIENLTRGLVGHVQVHGLGYQASPEIANVVPNATAVEDKLIASVPGAHAEKRVLGAGLAGAGEASSAVMVMGIEPDVPDARQLLAIEKGRALAASPKREVVIGSGLARELDVGPGGELVLVAQAADGSLANDRFTVVGTADAGSYE
ncbi:MAG TPA: ABC transporter permease, partial [Polyangiaceae bacterium]|nr:ABC transporter permease [Polyangiaceae bacterium]